MNSRGSFWRIESSFSPSSLFLLLRRIRPRPDGGNHSTGEGTNRQSCIGDKFTDRYRVRYVVYPPLSLQDQPPPPPPLPCIHPCILPSGRPSRFLARRPRRQFIPLIEPRPPQPNPTQPNSTAPRPIGVAGPPSLFPSLPLSRPSPPRRMFAANYECQKRFPPSPSPSLHPSLAAAMPPHACHFLPRFTSFSGAIMTCGKCNAVIAVAVVRHLGHRAAAAAVNQVRPLNSPAAPRRSLSLARSLAGSVEPRTSSLSSWRARWPSFGGRYAG